MVIDMYPAMNHAEDINVSGDDACYDRGVHHIFLLGFLNLGA